MARQTTLNVSLTPTLRGYVRKKVSSGQYESASEVIRDGLRALQDRERASDAFWGTVREKVSVARRELAAGKTVDGARAMDDILAGLDQPLGAGARTPRRARRRAG